MVALTILHRRTLMPTGEAFTVYFVRLFRHATWSKRKVKWSLDCWYNVGGIDQSTG